LPFEGATHPIRDEHAIAEAHTLGYSWDTTHDVVPFHLQLQSHEPTTSEYLALYGASELFEQLDKMEPRKPRPTRSNYGASELFAQLDQMEPREPRRRRRKGAGRKRN